MFYSIQSGGRNGLFLGPFLILLILSVSFFSFFGVSFETSSDMNFLISSNLCWFFSSSISGSQLLIVSDTVTSGVILLYLYIVSKLIKNNGFGDSIACFSKAPDDPSHVIHSIRKIEVQVQEVLEKAKELAVKTLQKEKVLLLEMSSILTQKTVLDKAKIEVLFKKYGKFILKDNSTFYRSILQNELTELKQNENLLKIDAVRFNSER